MRTLTLTDLGRAVLNALAVQRPPTICPMCLGAGCKSCDGTGHDWRMYTT